MLKLLLLGVVWMKYDFMRLGSLRVGHVAPDCHIHDLTGESTRLLDIIEDGSKPVVLVGGSYS